MPRPLIRAAALVVMTMLGPSAILAHEGEEELAVEPSSVTAGGRVILAGSGLEPESDRVIVWAGLDLIVEFGTVRTDSDGMFQRELTVPSHLPSGGYELRAIGDETLVIPLAITAAAGAGQAALADEQGSHDVLPLERTPVELALLAAFVAVTAIVGLLLVVGAERFRSARSA